jgi:subtilisin family serine protease
LAVTTLALGGRGIEKLRKNARLPIEIGEASLIMLDNPNPILSSGQIERSIKFAKAPGNDFDVINLSLSSSERIALLDGLVNDTEKHLVLVVAAGNDGKVLDAVQGVWPAALGGTASTGDASTSAIISVGAHDGDGNYVSFSNRGPGVDILAPGCSVPAYNLKLDGNEKIVGVEEQSITGTSIAAPLVSFVAAMLVSDAAFVQRPGLVKLRIQASSDYDYVLQQATVSSGILNVAKAIGFKFDIVETNDNGNGAVGGAAKQNFRKIRFGDVTLRSASATFKCGFDLPLSFNSIRKIARGKNQGDPVLVLSTDDPTKPARLNAQFCPPDSLDGLQYDFVDAETSEKVTFKASETWDYVARQ